MKIRIVIRPEKIVIFCAQNQETEVLGIEMDYDHTHKMLVFSFVRELASFHVVNLCLNINDFVTKSHILVYEIDNIIFLWETENQITTGTQLSATIWWQIWSKRCTFCDKMSPKELILSRTYPCGIAMVKFWEIKKSEKTKFEIRIVICIYMRQNQGKKAVRNVR